MDALIHIVLCVVLVAAFLAAASLSGVMLVRLVRGQFRLYDWWPTWREATLHLVCITSSIAVAWCMTVICMLEHPGLLFL